MQHTPTGFILSAGDVTDHVACAHLTQLKRRVALGELFVPRAEDPHLELIKRRGREHERAVLAALDGGGHVAVPLPAPEPEALREAEARTLAAMRDGAPLVYQASFFDGRRRGHADFLVRTDAPSALGGWSYEVLDAKLARRLTPSMVHQLCDYSRHVERLQGAAPARAHVVLGDGRRETVALAPVLALHRHAVRRLEADLAAAPETYPEPVDHCAVCDFAAHCFRQRLDDDHLSLVAGVRRDQRARLVDAGIATMGALAAAPEDHEGGELRRAAFDLLRHQARLQVATRTTGRLQRRHLEPERARGYARLPAPDPGDVFFDLEGDPFAAEEGLWYLWGHELAGGGHHAVWAHDPAAERAAFEGFVDLVLARLAESPGMHVYHYSPAESGALKRLASRYATRESEIDALLRGGVLVDLFAVVRQGLQVGQFGYSLKDLEPFYMGARDTTIIDAGGSMVAYERWLRTGEDDVLEQIRAYNADDCRSTRLLRDWLWSLRDEAAAAFGVDFAELAVPVEEDPRGEPEWIAPVRALAERLCAGLPEDPEDDDEDAAERRLLSWLLLYHRRESLPAWWRHFDLRATTSVDLIGETDAIGGLEPDPGRPPVPVAKSTGHWMTFPPQETRLDPDDVVDPVTGDSAGEIVELDLAEGRLLLKRGPKFDGVALPTALIGRQPLPTGVQRAALVDLAEALRDGGGPMPAAARSILRRSLPRVEGVSPGAPLQGERLTVEDTVARALALRDSHLVVQGPPGTGKTYRGARIVVAALARGQRVAISAVSHKAIHNLLAEVEDVAHAERVPLRGFHKSTGTGSRYEARHGLIDSANSNASAADRSLNLVSGTSWLLAQAAHAGAFDLLVIDEAGQMSLADAVAIGRCARSIVLLGDPQQLPQVTQGTHPGRSGSSVLDHLLAGHATIPPQRGLFIPESRRLHPGVGAFVSEAMYDGRLRSLPECERRRVDARGALHGAGLRWWPVRHAGNSQASPEEAEVVARACRDLLDGGRVTDHTGAARAMTPQDILVVAPYNLAVRCLEGAVPDGVRVGTVDRFQGQEAPVVLYAMASSTAEDAPRGLGFLFSAHRLNVAVSRAQALAVIVASPDLLDARCATADQMPLVSRLCRFVELAEPVVR